MNSNFSSSVQTQVTALRTRTPQAEIVVIVGGGVSGLLTAYILLDRYGRRYIPVVLDGNTCHSRIGGNAYTVPVQVGEFERWVDLGVNDYNATTYRNIQSLLKKLGVEGKPLVDTTTWAGTNNGRGVSYVEKDIVSGGIDCDLARDYYRFKAEAYNDAMYGSYFKHSLADYAKEKGYCTAFLQLNLYPRVNGMYYADQTRPVPTMPLGAIMRYYGLQEGFGTGPADRRYFDQGSTYWLEALADAIRCMGGVVAARCEVSTFTSSGKNSDSVRVHFAPAWCPWWKTQTAESAAYVDCSKVVIAAHADVANRLLADVPDTENVRALLQRIHYTTHEYQSSTGNGKKTLAVAHTDISVLPDPQKPSTYNITIHEDYNQPNPYTISYCCNSHQNDAENPDYACKEVPNFYVTINPPPDKQPSEERILQTLYTAPDGSTQLIQAIAHFSHNTESEDTWDVQLEICEQYQGLDLLGGKLYFSGGWGIGAGLHEECWYAADMAVRRIAGVVGDICCRDLIGPATQQQDVQGKIVHAPPHHLRIAMGRVPQSDDG